MPAESHYLDALLALTAAVHRADGPHAIHTAALDALTEGLGVRRSSILLFDDDGVMRFKAWRGLSETYRRAVEGHTPWAPGARGARPIVVADVAADPELRAYRAIFDAEGIAALAFVPLIASGGVVGKFMLYYDAPHPRNEQELAAAEVIAAQIAYAVERSRAERELRDREDQLRLVTDRAPVLLAHCDRDRRYRWVNNGYAERFGLRPEELVGRRIAEVVGTEAFESFRHYIDAALDGESVEFEAAVPYERIGRRTMHCLYAPDRGPDGAVRGLVAVIADVTERRQMQAALTDRERHLQAVVETTPECVKVVAADGTLLQMNAAGLAMVEAESADAVIGGCVYDLIAPEHRERFRAFNERVCGGEKGTLEFEIVGRRGTPRVMETHAVPLTAPDGGFAQLAITRDVTERRNAERALRESEARFRQLADALPQIVWMARPDGHLDYYNQRWYEFTGFSPALQGDESWKPILHPDDVQPTVDRWYQSVQSGQPYEMEYRFVDRRTGAYRWHLGRALPLRDEAGRVVRWFGTCTDIDDQKRAEQTSRFLAKASASLSALVDVETTLRTVAELAVPDFADWCVVHLADDEGTLRLAAVAHRDQAQRDLAAELERLYPSRPDEPNGPRQVLRTGAPELIAEISDQILARIAKDPDHLQFLRGLGLRSFITVPLTSRGRMFGTVSFATAESGRRYRDADLALAVDLSHRASIAIENARLYAEVRRADRQKDEFLAVLAHELRNPLAPLRTALELMRAAPPEPGRSGRACAVMDRQIRQLTRLVDDLLDLSRITRARIHLQRERITIASAIEAAVEISRPAIDAAEHGLAVDLPDEPLEVEADPTRLAQIFANILNNAAKYTPGAGRIRVSVAREGGAAVVRVRDTGIGIPHAMLARIFEMFAQVDRSAERSYGGLGIGLTLAKRLVELHGGTIAARSDGPGTGSEFVVTLPLAAAGAPGATPGRTTTAVGGRTARPLRILMADDNRDAADTLSDVLRIAGHEVDTAYDGQQAVDAAALGAYDVVLLDLGMPRLSGFAAAREIRARARGPLLLVALTGWGQAQDRQRSAAAGFDHHLVKPVDAESLLELLSAEPTN